MSHNTFQFVGPSCGHHAAYTFYKAIKYQKNGKTKILSLGEFFFVKIWSDSDIVSIGELQLLWEDKNTNQVLSSLRLYFLPEYTPEGRLHYHGEDEVVAVAEKSILRVVDLLDWIAYPDEVSWDRGLSGVSEEDCIRQSEMDGIPVDKNLSTRFSPGHSDFLSDIREEKKAIGDIEGIDDLAVIILSISQYGRYRSVLKRLAGVEKKWMHNSLVAALGGFTTATRKTYVLFCRENFDYPELEEHPYLCNHLSPKLKGRPRKKKKIKRPGSPESESASSESSVSTSVSISAPSKNSSSAKNGVKKDLLSILSQKNTKEELDFLKKLIHFMDKRNTPIERPPMLGFKQIDLHLFYEKVNRLGGYEGCMSKKSWKAIYDDLGGNPQNTSAATCTRRHYEKFLLPYERHVRGQEKKGAAKKAIMATTTAVATNEMATSEDDKESHRSPMEMNDNKSDEKEYMEAVSSPASIIEIKPNEVTTNPEVAIPKQPPAAQEHLPSTKTNTVVTAVTTTTKSEEEILVPSKIVSSALPNNPMLAQPGIQSLVGSKLDSHLKIDPDGKRLQIDDLIIIPNNLHSPPEGGSALQNLAKIASRYQNSGGKRNEDQSSLIGGKKPRLDDKIAATQAVPPSKKVLPPSTTAATSCLNPVAAAAAAASGGTGGSVAAAAAANLFSMLPPGLLPSWPIPGMTLPTPNKTGSSLTPSSATTTTTKGGIPSVAFPLPDPSKLGPEGYNLLQFYEKQVKNATSALLAGAASSGTGTSTPRFPDPAKLGPDGLLLFYEKELKNAQQKINGKDIQKNNLNNTSKESKDRTKVSKPPPDTKRPPSLLQTPCAFVQTTSIYTNPLSELTKARETANKSGNSSTNSSAPSYGCLDLTSSSKIPYTKPEPHPSPSVLNLKKETHQKSHSSSSRFSSSVDLSVKKEPQLMLSSTTSRAATVPVKNELKASPFSAEALLSKPSKHPDLVKVSPSPSLSVRSGLMSEPNINSDNIYRSQKSGQESATPTSTTTATTPRPSSGSLSLIPPRASPIGSVYSSSSHSPSTGVAVSAANIEKARTSPWHTPVSHQSPRSEKPAIPVSPIVRDNNKKLEERYHASLMGLSSFASTPSSTSSLAASTPLTTSVGAATSLAYSLASAATTPPHISLPLPPLTLSFPTASSYTNSSFSSNPYLALMSTAGHSSLPKAPSSAPTAPPGSAGYPAALAAAAAGAHLMDPATSAYYAALFSQQMYGAAGLSPYATAAGLVGTAGASLRSGFPQAAPPPPPPAGTAAAGIDHLQASALQAMMARSSAAAAAAASPFGVSYPSGLSGLHGYPGFPPSRKDP